MVCGRYQESAWSLMKKLHKSNTSGTNGVTMMKDGRRKCWQASIRIEGKYHVKYFFERVEAVAQRLAWEVHKEQCER